MPAYPIEKPLPSERWFGAWRVWPPDETLRVFLPCDDGTFSVGTKATGGTVPLPFPGIVVSELP